MVGIVELTTQLYAVTPERTCLPKQVQKFLFPIIRRVYLPDNSALLAENDRIQNLLNGAQTARRRLEDQVGHLMEQCERHMSSSAAHAKGEKDALTEVEKLRKRLGREIEARKAAENKADSLASKTRKTVDNDVAVKEAIANSNTLKTLSFARQPQHAGNDEFRGVKATGPKRGRLEVEDVDTDSEDEWLISTRPPSTRLSSRPPARSTVQPETPVSDAQTTQSTSATTLDASPIVLSDEDASDSRVQRGSRPFDAHRFPWTAPVPPMSSITPRRRVMRNLPVRPPTKRMRA
ncbi:hypothetical protein V5O48_005483 [Marasmius crinis-equi]|uniref:Uncharacterized protein n=1 Tax=Marasmius crinis-equi TaxID=585013 RepID=A0ABR3FMQ7_9AGAR